MVSFQREKMYDINIKYILHLSYEKIYLKNSIFKQTFSFITSHQFS